MVYEKCLAPVWAVPRGTEGARIMVQAGAAHGMTVAECLAGTGITEGDLSAEDAEIWAHQEFALIRNLIARLGDRPGLGVEIGRHSTLGRAGVIAFAMLATPTVGAAANLALRYLALSPTHLQFSIESDAEYVYLVADDGDIPEDVRAFIVERDLAGLAIAVPMAFGKIAPIGLELNLDRERAHILADIWQVAAADVSSERHRNRLVGPRAILDLPLPQADENTARLFERQCRELLEHRLERVGFTGQVRNRLLYNTGDLPSMHVVADELHIDPRTLRRRLSDEGTSFRDLLGEVRRKLAVDLLTGSNLTVGEIANRLGYTETANFTNAFKGWFGEAPSRFRRR